MDNANPWVWILIAVVALVLVAGLVYALTKGKQDKERRRLEQENKHREEAARLRDEGRQATVTARQTEATAAAAAADAEQARLEAERLERQAQELKHEAAEVKQTADEHLTKADEIDPDVAARAQNEVSEDRPAFTGKHGGPAEDGFVGPEDAEIPAEGEPGSRRR